MKNVFIFVFIMFAVAPGALAQEDEKETDKTFWDNEVSLSYIRTTGNTDTSTISSSVETRYDSKVHDFSAKAYFTLIETDGEESANRFGIEGQYEYGFNERFFTLIRSEYKRDKYSGYDYRFFAGPGIGYNHWDSDQRLLKTFVAVLYRKDDYREESLAPDQATILSLNNEVRYKFSDLVEGSNSFEYNLDIEQTDDYQILNETELAVKMNSNMSLGVSYSLAYQNLPPTRDLENLDTIFLTSLIIDF